MSNNQSYNEKLLKVFTGIRCLNRDQLPRYLEGRQTELEKHLVEQHLVDCDLCHEALQALKKDQHREQYPAMAANIQQYVRDSIRSVSQSQKMEQFIRREKKKESFLIYFWILAFAVLGVSAVFLSQGYMRNKPAYRPTTIAAVPAATPVSLPVDDSNREQPVVDGPSTEPTVTPVREHAVTPAVAGAKATTPTPTPPPRKDTAKAKILPPPKDTRKPADSPASKAAADKARAADSLRRIAEKAAADKAAAEKTAAEKARQQKEKEQEKEAAAKSEKEKPAANKSEEKEKNNVTAEPANTDEYLYKAAMVYQQQGDLGEAMSRYKRLASSSTGRYGEMAQYQLGVCYRSKGQMGRARRAFKEVIRMNGNMKDAAQKALDNL